MSALYLKWKLMLTTLPLVVVVLFLRVAAERWFGFQGVVEFSDISVVLTAGVFLTGFLLTGTMADYKESEKLPGEIAATLETIEEFLAQACIGKPSLNVGFHRAVVLKLSQTIEGYFYSKQSMADVFKNLSELHVVIQDVESQGSASAASRVLGELHYLRKALTRVNVIKRTGFLPPAYALLETLLGIILVLLLASKFKSPLAEYILVPFVTLIYVYMLRLIKDVDDPFDYRRDGLPNGGAEVDLFPLREYIERLSARV